MTSPTAPDSDHPGPSAVSAADLDDVRVPHDLSPVFPRVRRVPPPELGPMLAAARLRAGLRLRECARLLQLNPTYVARLESGQRVPSVTVAGRIADALALDPDERAALFAVAVDDAGEDHPWRRSKLTGGHAPDVVLGRHPNAS